MLLELVARLVVVVATATLVGLFVIVGLDRLTSRMDVWWARLVSVAPEVTVLGLVLLTNNLARQFGPEVSWIIGIEVTDAIYQLEGGLVIWIQSFATPAMTTFFSRIYVYGYVFLLVFPLVAYLALDDMRPLRTLILAYAFNYVIGLVCYLVIIAYGPRNLLPDLVEPLLYTTFPEYQELTRQVNRNTNVFPSLHASLSVTVAAVSYRTRTSYPRWFPVATLLAASVIVSTMYLGIH
ncbi:MAG: phosphatase PAP2 family protein, partial [Halobacteriota archaeon]